MSVQIASLTAPSDTSPIVGIDLGTTNSLVAYVGKEPDASGLRVPRILRSREGKNLLPSVVSFASGQPVVGYEAKKRRVCDAESTVFSVKRLLGRGFEDLRGTVGNLPYRILPGQGLVRIQVGDKVFTAIEISAAILRELKRSAEAELGIPVRRAVITVPAYFNDSQRQATRAAGRLAGWDVLRIINEPTAASLAYGLNRKKEGMIAVYDLGGGTFDISILKLQDGIFEVLSTNGNSALGGDDIDLAVATKTADEIRAQYGFDPLDDRTLRASLLEAAENLKIGLSENPAAEMQVLLPGNRAFTRPWTLDEFETLVAPILEETVGPCEQALQDAGIRPEELSDTILVGGPTRLACVQRIAARIFKRPPNTSVNPDEVVAAGAAIQADILAGNNKDFLLLDVVPLSLGIETYGGLMSPLIPRNTRIPTVAREVFTTFVDNQTAVDIHVFQGERERVADNRSLARFKLRGIPPQSAGLPRVEVTFVIDADGILQVAARDLKTGNEQSIEVRPSYGLTDEEVEKMLLASLDHLETDIAVRTLIEVRNDAEAVLRAAEKRLPEAQKLLSEDEYQDILQAITGLKFVLPGNQIAPILESKRKLNDSTVRLAELLLKSVIAEAVDGDPQEKGK